MPFTLSHAAAVLPLTRLPVPSSALVVGSISPDLTYFVPGLPGRATTHSPSGVLTVDVPLGLLVFVVWHALLAPPLLHHLLDLRVHVRLGLRWRLAPSRLPALVAGLALGAATHLVWDSFTHSPGFGVDHFGPLAQSWGPLEGYRWAQYASGVFGLAVLAWWALRTARRILPPAYAPPRGSARVALALVGVALLGAAGGALLGRGAGARATVFDAVVAGCAATGALVLLAAVRWHLRRPSRR